MRQKKPFPTIRRETRPEPEPPPSRWEVVRRRLRRTYIRFHDVLLVVTAMAAALVALSLLNAANPPPRPPTQRDVNAAVARAMASATPRPSYASQAYEVIRPSVVLVHALGPNAGTKTEGAIGTGVVIQQNGAILTSLHVVQGATEVLVVFADGSESAAQVVVSQPENDLAVLRPSVVPDDLVPATMAGSPAIGDEVFAVGNPFGVSGSITGGVVSGLGRTFQTVGGQKLSDLIQFDAAVNPGNSGGPLVNRNGEVVGIVTGLMNPTGQDVFIGLGFAVPIETASAALGTSPY